MLHVNREWGNMIMNKSVKLKMLGLIEPWRLIIFYSCKPWKNGISKYHKFLKNRNRIVLRTAFPKLLRNELMISECFFLPAMADLNLNAFKHINIGKSWRIGVNINFFSWFIAKCRHFLPLSPLIYHCVSSSILLFHLFLSPLSLL